MVVDEVVGAGAVVGKSAGFFLPFGKWNLIITCVVFGFLLVQGTIASVEQHSLFPVFDRAVFPFIAADAKISQSVDDLAFSDNVKPDAWFKMPFSAYFWERVLFVLNIIGLLWLLYFFFLLIFSFMKMLNSTSIFICIISSIILFIFISGYANLLLYDSHMAGLVRDNNPLGVIKNDLSHSVPLSGVVKLVRFVFDKGYAYDLVNSPVTKVFSNIDINNSGGMIDNG